MTVSTQTLAISPCLGDGISGLRLGQAQHLGHDGRRGNLDQHDVVQADLVERVLQSQDTLDLVGLDHALQDILDLEDLAIAQVAASTVRPGDPVGHGQNTSQVVGRMTPLSGQPAVIVVQPADHGANVESAIDRVELVGGSRHTSSIRDGGAGNDGAQQFGALLESEGLETTSQGVQENQTGSVVL